jgi:hypothetical protein
MTNFWLLRGSLSVFFLHISLVGQDVLQIITTQNVIETNNVQHRNLSCSSYNGKPGAAISWHKDSTRISHNIFSRTTRKSPTDKREDTVSHSSVNKTPEITLFSTLSCKSNLYKPLICLTWLVFSFRILHNIFCKENILTLLLYTYIVHLM